jgi:hypothetical protein
MRNIRTTPALPNSSGDADTGTTFTDATIEPHLGMLPQFGRRALLALSFGLAKAASGSAARADTLTRGGKMTFGRYQDATYLDPVIAQYNSDIWLLSNLFDNLVELGPDGKVVQPGLATKWEVSSDAKAVTFVLREGIKFADGSPLTAEDIKFSLERAGDPNIGFWASMLHLGEEHRDPRSRSVGAEPEQPGAGTFADPGDVRLLRIAKEPDHRTAGQHGRRQGKAFHGPPDRVRSLPPDRMATKSGDATEAQSVLLEDGYGRQAVALSRRNRIPDHP